MNRTTAAWLACALPGLAASVCAALEAPTTPTPTAPSAPTAPTATLRPYEASYNFLWRGLNAGTSTFKLRQEPGGEWLYTSRNEPRGLFKLVSAAAMTLTSHIKVDAETVRPLLFTAHENDETALQAEVHFDWTTGRATGKVEDTPIDMPLRAGVQDDLSVQIAFIVALANGRSPQGISMFDKNGIKDYTYTRVGEETLHTPVGEVATTIYLSQHTHSPRSTRFWCAPQYGYVPMRAEQRREDKVEWTMNLRSIHRD